MTIRAYGANGKREDLSGIISWSGAAPPQLYSEQFGYEQFPALGTFSLPFEDTPDRIGSQIKEFGT